MNGDLPARERSRLLEPHALLGRADVEHDCTSVRPYEVVVPNRKPARPIRDVLVQSVVRLARCRPRRREGIHEKAARVHGPTN
jgi:hypothetical protein